MPHTLATAMSMPENTAVVFFGNLSSENIKIWFTIFVITSYGAVRKMTTPPKYTVLTFAPDHQLTTLPASEGGFRSPLIIL